MLAVQKKALENLPVVLDQGSISAFQINGKRKLIVDEVKAIAGEEIKAQLSTATPTIVRL